MAAITQRLVITLGPEQRISRTEHGDDVIRQICEEQLPLVTPVRVDAVGMPPQARARVLLPAVAISTLRSSPTPAIVNRRRRRLLTYIAVTTVNNVRAADPRAWLLGYFGVLQNK
jgi:hypothetical protein